MNKTRKDTARCNYLLYFYEYWHCNFFEKQDDEKAAEKFKEATEAYEVLSDEVF